MCVFWFTHTMYGHPIYMGGLNFLCARHIFESRRLYLWTLLTKYPSLTWKFTRSKIKDMLVERAPLSAIWTTWNQLQWWWIVRKSWWIFLIFSSQPNFSRRVGLWMELRSTLFSNLQYWWRKLGQMGRSTIEQEDLCWRMLDITVTAWMKKTAPIWTLLWIIYYWSSPSFQENRTSQSKLQQQIPYQDSMLTTILRDALGGNSISLMIGTLSPSSIDYQNSLNTLTVAALAKGDKKSCSELWLLTAKGYDDLAVVVEPFLDRTKDRTLFQCIHKTGSTRGTIKSFYDPQMERFKSQKL